MKKSIFKVMSFLLVLAIMIPVAVLPSMAATSYKDSIASSVDQTDDETTVGYDETQGKSTTYVDNVNRDSNNKVDVYVTQASTFNVKLPKTIILNGAYGQTNSGAYEVEVEGNLASDEVVSCTPPILILL